MIAFSVQVLSTSSLNRTKKKPLEFISLLKLHFNNTIIRFICFFSIESPFPYTVLLRITWFGDKLKHRKCLHCQWQSYWLEICSHSPVNVKHSYSNHHPQISTAIRIVHFETDRFSNSLQSICVYVYISLFYGIAFSPTDTSSIFFCADWLDNFIDAKYAWNWYMYFGFGGNANFQLNFHQ